MYHSHIKSTAFQQEILNLLQPKINTVLYQTSPQERPDLKQEIYVLIIQTIQTKKFKKAPSFFELLEAENLKEKIFY